MKTPLFVACLLFIPFFVSTNYSHAGQSIRVSINNQSGENIGDPAGTSSGVKKDTPVNCQLVRNEVLGTPDPSDS